MGESPKLPSPPQFQFVSVDLVDDSIAIVKYNRPDAANAINSSVSHDYFEALKWASNDPRVRVIINTGVGKFFCTGMDLSPDEPSTPGGDLLQSFREIISFFVNCPKILIAAVNGPAAGWGTSSLGLFDLVYAVPEAYFFTPFVKWGLSAEASASFIFPYTIGRQKASRLLLAGERLSAQELESAGLISQILPNDGFMDTVLTSARRICALPPRSLAANKQLMMRYTKSQIIEANEFESELFLDLLRGDESSQRFATFKHEQALKKESRSRVPTKI